VVAVTDAATEVGNYFATLPRKRMGAAVYFRDAADRVLMVEPTYKPDWTLPGGAVEAGESPYEAAAREVEEELGLTVQPGRLLLVDWFPPHENHTEGVGFVYDGGRLGAQRVAGIKLPADELRDWAWLTPEEAARRGSSLLARELTAATRALAEDATYYLEFGRIVV
jgi:8-oxo-dGTP pyrophosphatase MutT (NUDIX family)